VFLKLEQMAEDIAFIKQSIKHTPNVLQLDVMEYGDEGIAFPLESVEDLTLFNKKLENKAFFKKTVRISITKPFRSLLIVSSF
jgi:hypothetical protein